jgi:outer membrane receptor protein involved in Fe transport
MNSYPVKYDSCALRLLVAALVALFLATGAAWAQNAGARIVGNVTDARGASVPAAKVIVVNVATQVHYDTSTNRDGYFQALDLPIGSYNVSLQADGFRTLTYENQVLQINQVLRLDAKLDVGSVAETVEVKDQAEVIETVNPTLGASITGRTLTDAPLNGRNALDLALLQPGVTPKNPDARGAAGTYDIGGGRSDSVTFLLDGGQNNEILGNAVVFNPNPDTIAEFRILENNYTAEYGRNGGGVISEVTKSGTNDWHGSAFDFIRNGDFNANRFFNKNDPNNLLPRDTLRRNQVGGTFGGPITIPHVVHGKDRFFFFVGYQQQIQSDSVSSTGQTVFTPAQLNGDFSGANSTPANGVCPNADPNVAAFLQANSFFQSNATLAGCAVIDPTKINSVAQKYIAASLIPSSPTGILNSQAAGTDNRKELTMRFDFNVTDKDRLSVTLGGSKNPTLVPFDRNASGAPGFGSLNNTNNYFTNFAYTRTFAPNLLNEFRATTQRNNILSSVPQRTLSGPAALGFTNLTPDQTTGPPILFFDSSVLTVGFSPQGPSSLIQNAFVYSDTVSWTHGRHTFKFGGGFSAYQTNINFDFFVNGSFDFVGANGIGTGNDFADFLTGQPIDFFQAPKADTNARTKFTYGFAQDEWRAAKNLTLTLGVRYEYSTPKLDTHGDTFDIIPGKQSTLFPNAPVGLVFPGDTGAPRGVNFPDKNNWAPRLGFAWDPKGDSKTSIRGGFGVFYDLLKAEDNFQDNGQPPFFASAFQFFNPLAGNPTAEVPNLADPFTNSVNAITNPFPSKPVDHNINFGNAGFLPFGSTAIFFDDPHLRTPYTYQYNLSIQREISTGTSLEVGYIGSSSHGLTSLADINPFVLGTTDRVLNLTPGNSSCLDSSGNSSSGVDPAATCSFSNLEEFKNVSKASYNALEASLRRQLTDTKYVGRVYFTFGYTYAHSIDNSSGFRNRNSSVPAYQPNLFRASSDFDVRNRITFSGGWDLPVDRFLTSAPKRLTQGWSLFPIVSWRTGFPLDVFSSIDSGGGFTNEGTSGAGDPANVFANLVGPVNTFNPHQSQSLTGEVSGTRSGNFFFNPAAFSTAQVGSNSDPCPTPSPSCFPSSAQVAANPALATYGTLPRNFFRGPSQTNVDMSLTKSTALFRERVKLEIRGDFFNIFNHTEFNNPVTSITSPKFGQVIDTADPRIIQIAARFTF